MLLTTNLKKIAIFRNSRNFPKIRSCCRWALQQISVGKYDMNIPRSFMCYLRWQELNKNCEFYKNYENYEFSQFSEIL